MRYRITYTGKGKHSLIISYAERFKFTDGKTYECSEEARRIIQNLPEKTAKNFTIEPIKEVVDTSKYVTGEEKPIDKHQRDVTAKDIPKRTLANVIEDKRRGSGLKQFHHAI